MKSSKSLLTFLLIGLFLITTSANALAAVEAWTTDPATGCKIGIVFLTDGLTLVSANWSGPMAGGLAEGQGKLQFIYKDKSGTETKVQADAEMKAGKMDGHVSIKWSDGDSFEGNYREGLREGRGVYKFTDNSIYDGEWKAGKQDGRGVYKLADGRVYDGEWKAGKQDGYGVGKDATGKVIHEGQWKNGEPVKDGQAVGSSPGGALKADKVLGIPWGATDDQARRILTQRPNTKAYSFMNGKDAFDRWNGYSGPFADFSDAEIFVHFYQDKMWMVQVSWPLKEDQVIDRFNAVKQGLTERYGAPMVEKGKYLDSYGLWDLGGAGRGYTVNLQIRKNTIRYIASVDPATTHPFRVFITYYNQSVADLFNQTAKPGGSGSKDY